MTRRADLPPVPRGWARCRLCGKADTLEAFGWNRERGQWYATCTGCRWKYSTAQTSRLRRQAEARAADNTDWKAAWEALGLPLPQEKKPRVRKKA